MSRKLNVLMGFAVATLVIVCAIEYRYGVRFFQQLNAMRLDPLGLEQYKASLPPPLPEGHRRVVFLGDSRAEMWGEPSGQGVLKLQFVNRGVSFQTSAQILGRFESDVAPLKPDVLVLELGVNDLKCIPLFPKKKQEIIANVKANIRTLVTRGLDTGAIVVLGTVFPLGPVPLHRRPFWSDDVADSIATVNRFIETLPAENSSGRVKLLRSEAVLLGSDRKLRNEFAHDMLHLTPAAYAAINERLLLPLLKQSD